MYKAMVGDLVVSLCGHDKDELFIVTDVDGEYVVICDGKVRKISKNKKKKNKHIKSTGLNTDLINNAKTFEVDAICRREIKRLKELI